MFKSWSGGMEAGARLVGGGRPGVAGNPVGTGEETRSSVTFNVPQAVGVYLENVLIQIEW
jgi:hypothetical protein